MWPIDISRLSTDTKLSLSHYALDNKANETRVVGGFDIDLSFPFSSETTLFGSEANHQLIPIISYEYTSKKKQASIPIFDTSDGIISIEANESSILTFQTKNINIDNFTEINFDVIPINHKYAKKKSKNTRNSSKIRTQKIWSIQN